MIQINLLPEECRRKARTPLKLMLAVSVAVAINGSLAAYWAWMSFGVAAEVDTERAVAQLEMDGLTPQVNYHSALDKEIKVHQSREKTLSGIMDQRVLWTQKLDELIDVVNLGQDGLRHYVWLDDLSVTQGKDPRSKAGGSLKAQGHSGSADGGQVANFLEDIENPELTPFPIDFNRPDNPEAQQSSVDETLIPSEVWSFPLAMDLKTAEDRIKAHAAFDSKEQDQ